MITINPTTPVPEKRDIDTLLQLIQLLRDPSATAAGARRSCREEGNRGGNVGRPLRPGKSKLRPIETARKEKSLMRVRSIPRKCAKIVRNSQMTAPSTLAEVKKREAQTYINDFHVKLSADAREAAADLRAELERRIALVRA